MLRKSLGVKIAQEYDSGMTTKITVSLPDNLVTQAKLAVTEGSAASVSAYVAEAMRAHGRRETLEEILDEWEAEDGPPSADDYAWADEMLGLGPAR